MERRRKIFLISIGVGVILLLGLIFSLWTVRAKAEIQLIGLLDSFDFEFNERLEIEGLWRLRCNDLQIYGVKEYRIIFRRSFWTHESLGFQEERHIYYKENPEIIDSAFAESLFLPSIPYPYNMLFIAELYKDAIDSSLLSVKNPYVVRNIYWDTVFNITYSNTIDTFPPIFELQTKNAFEGFMEGEGIWRMDFIAGSYFYAKEKPAMFRSRVAYSEDGKAYLECVVLALNKPLLFLISGLTQISYTYPSKDLWALSLVDDKRLSLDKIDLFFSNYSNASIKPQWKLSDYDQLYIIIEEGLTYKDTNTLRRYPIYDTFNSALPSCEFIRVLPNMSIDSSSSHYCIDLDGAETPISSEGKNVRSFIARMINKGLRLRVSLPFYSNIYELSQGDEVALKGGFNINTTFEEQKLKIELEGEACSIKINGVEYLPSQLEASWSLLLGLAALLVAFVTITGFVAKVLFEWIPKQTRTRRVSSQRRKELARRTKVRRARTSTPSKRRTR